MPKLPQQQRFRGSKWSLFCGLLCLLALAVRLWAGWFHQYALLPDVLNGMLSLFLLFLAYRFFYQYFGFLRLNQEYLIISGIFRSRKIPLPDIEQMSLGPKNKNLIYLLMADGTELKINLLDLPPDSREAFKKAFYRKS